MDGYPAARQIGRQFRKHLGFPLRPAIFDSHVLAFDVAGLAKALRGTPPARELILHQLLFRSGGARSLASPTAARAQAIGHVAAAPPISVDECDELARLMGRTPRDHGLSIAGPAPVHRSKSGPLHVRFGSEAAQSTKRPVWLCPICFQS